MNNTPKILLLVATLVAASTASAASSFGVQFSRGTNLVSGVVLGTSAWTNSGVATGDTENSSGSFATTEPGVSVAFGSSGYWDEETGAVGTTGGPDQGLNLFHDYLDDGGDWDNSAGPVSLGTKTGGNGIGAVVQVTGLSAWLASNHATAYTVKLLLGTDSDGFRTYTVHKGNLQGAVLASGDGVVRGDGNWDGTTLVAGADQSGMRGDVTFAGLGDDVITINGLVNDEEGNRGSIAGFVITAVPATVAATVLPTVPTTTPVPSSVGPACTGPLSPGLIGAIAGAITGAIAGALVAIAILRRRKRAE